MDDDALEQMARRLLIMAVVALVASLMILAYDFRIKRNLIAEADQWRREVSGHGHPQQQPRGHVPQQQQQPAPPRGGGNPGGPGPVRPGPGPDSMGGPAGPPEGEDQPRAAPIVPPGLESARPPHRGAVDG